ncbi:MAG: glycosyltransferase family 39 protein, partial [Acidobacteria bacterium]|nr:glycosyltransferase family 39 protein [Acidobacteriota bacterium]
GFRRFLPRHPAGWWLLAVMGLGLVLDVTGIGWGLPSHRGWAPDEIVPEFVLDALAHRFARGWFDIYPLTQYVLLGALYLPVMFVARLASIPADHLGLLTAFFLINRVVSVAFGVATLGVVYLCGRELFDRHAGVAAALIVALMPQWVYYSKLANVDVPCLFWFLLSMYFFLRLIRTRRSRDLYWLAATAALSVATKDQAYAFYVLTAVAVGVVVFRPHAPGQAPASTTVWRGIRQIALAAAIAAGVFALGHNLLLNWRGFVAHVRFITGPASDYRHFAATWSGNAAMLWEAVRQVRWSLGWPAAALCVVGLIQELRHSLRNRAFLLLLPVVSYYIFLIAIVGYLFDRFLLGACLVLALFGGKLAADLTAAGRPWRRPVAAVLAVACAFAILNAASVDALMLNDSRYALERWLQEHVPPGQVLASVGRWEGLPRPEIVGSVLLKARAEDLSRVRPDFLVINREYLCRFDPGKPERALFQALADGRLGYERVFQVKTTIWWAVLAYEPAMSGPCEDPFTNLDKINPAMEVYRRLR